LQALLERAKTVVVSDDKLQAQRASFVYGTPPKDSKISKEPVLEAVLRILIADSPA
jgi:hypothetical protein